MHRQSTANQGIAVGHDFEATHGFDVVSLSKHSLIHHVNSMVLLFATRATEKNQTFGNYNNWASRQLHKSSRPNETISKQ